MLDRIKNVARAMAPKRFWSHLRAYKQPLDVYTTDRFNFFPVSHRPLVIYSFTGKTLGNVFHMARVLDGKPASFIVGFTRHPSSWKALYLRRQLRHFRARYPQHRIHFIVASQDELQNFRALGFDASLVNKNAFQRESLFYIVDGAEKKYDAVMNARMLRWKRVELAREIKKNSIYYCNR